jgi:hypothetical protein
LFFVLKKCVLGMKAEDLCLLCLKNISKINF